MSNKTLDINKETERLMKGYIDVCHRAVTENPNKIYAKLSKKLGHFATGNIHFTAQIYDQSPDIITDEFDITYNLDKQKLKVQAGKSQQSLFTWKVPIKYLRDVVDERTEWFVEQPLRLDFKWLTDRLRSNDKPFYQKPKFLLGFSLGLAATFATFYLMKKRA